MYWITIYSMLVKEPVLHPSSCFCGSYVFIAVYLHLLDDVLRGIPCLHPLLLCTSFCHIPRLGVSCCLPLCCHVLFAPLHSLPPHLPLSLVHIYPPSRTLPFSLSLAVSPSLPCFSPRFPTVSSGLLLLCCPYCTQGFDSVLY